MKEVTEKDQPARPPIAMTSPLPTPSQLLEENEELRTRLERAEEMLRAIRGGDGAALTLHSTSAPQVPTPRGQDTAANRFRGEMLARVNDAVIAVDEHDRISCFNAAAERLYGVTAASALGSSMAEIYQVRWLQPGDEAAAAAGLREHGEWHGEVAHVRHDGCDLSVEASITMLCDNDGRETGRIVVIRDVAERRLSHNRVMLSEMRYRRLFEAAHDGVLILDPVTRKIIDANPFMTQLLGYSHDQLIGRELYEIGFLADAQASREMFQTLKTTRQVRYENLPLQARQGGLRDVEVVANLYDEDGNIVVQCNVRDITERRRAEAKLEERQNFLAHIFEVLPGVLYVFDMDENRVVFVNNTGALTFSPEEVAGMGADLVQNLMHPDDQPRFQEHLARMRTLTPGETAAFEYRMRDRADEWRWYMGIDAVYLRDESGVARQIIGVAPEITERKRVELALQVSEQRFRTLIEATSAVTWSCAPSGQLIEFQPQWSAFTGQSASEMLGGGHATAFHPDDAEYAWARWADAVARDAPYHNELRIRRHDGEWRWMRVHCVPVHQDGITVEWFGMCIDITERKRAEEHAQLLMAEVNHRAKNLLSVVQAVAQQTAKLGDPSTFAARLSDRINGLAASQDLLVKNLWHGVGVCELVTSQLVHFKDLVGTRIDLHGPELTVTAAASQAIGMAVHELATNAAKYGALSNSDGHVHVDWQLLAAPESLFLMSWRESNGPQVKAPTRTGFGQTVLKRLVEASIDGNVKVDYAEDGFSWHLRTAAKNVLVMSGGGVMNPHDDAR